MVIEVSRVPQDELLQHAPDHTAEESGFRRQIAAARQRQTERNKGKTNSQLDNRSILAKAQLTPAAKALLMTASEKLKLSARSYFKVVKVARTIADLADIPAVTEAEISEALRYRSPS